jgi:predicted ArsR family transcriptional regulator
MSALEFLSSDTKRRLLELMNRRGEITLEAASEALDRAPPTLREHLNHMNRDGLVARRSQRQGRGRPRMCYRLTPRAERLFPRHDGAVFAEFLQYLDNHGETALIEGFFADFWEARRAAVEQRLPTSLEAADTRQVVDAVEGVLRDDGFMPQVQVEKDRTTIQECNCPFADIVEVTARPCASEGCFYESLFEEVERTQHMPDGDAACAYTID